MPSIVSSITAGGEFLLLLGGEWKKSSSGRTVEVRSPHSRELIGRIQQAAKGEIDIAFSEAFRAQKIWAEIPAVDRAGVMQRAAAIIRENKEELSQILVREISKPKKLADDEVLRTAELLEYSAEEGKRISGEIVHGDSLPGGKRNKVSLVERVPLGVVVAISPFNYPINLAASKIGPALVAGNSVVFKPATQGSVSGLYLAEVFVRAGLPKGCLSAMTGRGSEIGDYLVTHPKASAVYFTGGTPTGMRIAKSSGMIPLLLELGGKDAAIILPDANVEETAKAIVSGAFSYSGQRCTAVKRVLTIDGDSTGERVVSLVAELAGKLTVGRPEDDSDITNLIDDGAAEYVWELIEEARKLGAIPLNELKREGSLIHPVVFDRVPLESRLAWEEPFGPVLPVIRVKSVAEAVEIANKSEYGLQASVFTENIDRAFEIARALEVGTVQINGKPARGPDNFPFVGAKSSGIGAQGIRYSIENLTRLKSTVLNLR
ncbi:MAG: aldehyde dehydrogenase family protein [archaeon]